MKVLFLCRANAGRSQMAEAFYNALSGAPDAQSAGVDLKNSIMKDDLRVPPLVIKVMQEAGLDLSSCARKVVTPEMVGKADAVIALLEEREFPLPSYVTDAPGFVRWTGIPDAKGTDLGFHRKTRDVIRARVEALVGEA